MLRCLSDFSERGTSGCRNGVYMVGVQCDMLCTQNIVLLIRNVGWLLHKCEASVVMTMTEANGESLLLTEIGISIV